MPPSPFARSETLVTEIVAFLGSRTPDAWIHWALANPDLLLLDHKACEYKAASTALNLMAKYQLHADLVDKMSRLAREELVHHEQVMKLIKTRGIALRPLSAARYASGLRALVRREEPGMMTDILLIGAFIEARSCERFAALVPHLDAELAKFYAGLLESEGRHYRNYLMLAERYGDTVDIAERLDIIRATEQALIATPDTEFRFHSGPPADGLPLRAS
ncbi:MAG: tRNA-(ms[2]io[6]A)-hydroxylase [Asticcacaulis sp.]